MASSVGRLALDPPDECLASRKSPDYDSLGISLQTTDWKLHALDGVFEAPGAVPSNGSGSNDAVWNTLHEASPRLAHR